MNGFSRWSPARLATTVVALLTAACWAGSAPALAAPRTAGADAFHDSVGVVVRSTWLDTPYGRWPDVLGRVHELGAAHLRTALYGGGSAAFEARHLGDLGQAAGQGLRLHLIVFPDCSPRGELAPCLAAARELPRGSIDAFEWPSNMDHTGGPNWATALRAWGRELYTRVKGDPVLGGVPVVGPALARLTGPQLVLGDQSAYLDYGNLHPFTGALSPAPGHIAEELASERAIAGGKPVLATEAGFQTALGDPSPGQPPADERTAAVYTLRTVLEHYADGIDRTFLYELVDVGADPDDSVVNYGLLRHDLSPKPAFGALQRLLAMVGRAGPSGVRRLEHTVSGGGRDLREVVLQRADGTNLVILWRTASVWDRAAKRPLAVAPDTVTLRVPEVTKVGVGLPMTDGTMRPATLRDDDDVQVAVGADPVVLAVTGGRLVGPTAPTASGFLASSGSVVPAARKRDRTRPKLTRLRVRRMRIKGKGRRWVATFRVSEKARVGARLERRKPVGRHHRMRFRVRKWIHMRSMRKGAHRMVLSKKLRASTYRVRLTARDRADNRRVARVRFKVRHRHRR